MNTMKAKKLKDIRKEHFPDVKFPSTINKRAGKIFKTDGENAVIKFLSANVDPLFIKRTFQPTAKCNIIATSRPIVEWNISKFNTEVQNKIFSLTEKEFKELKIGTDKKSHDKFLTDNIINNYGYRNVQGENNIYRNAYNIYQGCIDKVDNRNKRKLDKLNKINKWREEKGLVKFTPLETEAEESAFDKDGYLSHRPGVNDTIYGYQSVGLKAINPNKDKEIIDQLPDGYNQYKLLSNNALISSSIFNRLCIPKNEPGFIPIWQRPFVKKYNGKRIRRRVDKQGALLCIAYFGDDWVVFDARGLLRNVYWRRSQKVLELTEDLSLNKLLDLFSGDPVIRPFTNEIYLSYKESIIKQETLEPIRHFYKSRNKILEKDNSVMISVDLGVYNEIAYRISVIEKNSLGELITRNLSVSNCSDDFKKEIRSARQRMDKLEETIFNNALQKLSAEQQKEYLNSQRSAEDNKNIICNKYNIDSGKLPWDQMTSGTYYISDAALVVDEKADVHIVNGEVVCLKSDFKHFKDLIFLSEEVRKNLNNFIWEEKRTSKKYKKIYIYIKETIRAYVNSLCKEAKMKSGRANLIIVIEDLEVKGSFFEAKGKRQAGWNNFLKPKTNNKWFIKNIHGAFYDLSQNKGIQIIEVSPKYTSQTCSQCKNCDAENRNGEIFKCKKCGYEANADKDIATFNIEQVALTGKALPGPERLPDVQPAVTARKRKVSKAKQKPDDIQSNVVILQETHNTARKAPAKCVKSLPS